MEATKRADGAHSELGVKLEAATERAKELCHSLQERTSAAAKATDEAVREHPYQALGIAFGVGVLIGILAAWRRHD